MKEQGTLKRRENFICDTAEVLGDFTRLNDLNTCLQQENQHLLTFRTYVI